MGLRFVPSHAWIFDEYAQKLGEHHVYKKQIMILEMHQWLPFMWVGAGKDVTTTVPRDFLGHLGALTRVVHLGVVDLKSSIIVISLLLSGSLGCQVSEKDFSVIFNISATGIWQHFMTEQLLPWLVVGLQIPVDISSVATADEAPNRENCTRIFANLECLMNTEWQWMCFNVFLWQCLKMYEYLSNYPRHFFAAQMVASAERGEPQACDRVDWQLHLRSWSFPFAQRERVHPCRAFLMHVLTFFDHFFQAATGVIFRCAISAAWVGLQNLCSSSFARRGAGQVVSWLHGLTARKKMEGGLHELNRDGIFQSVSLACHLLIVLKGKVEQFEEADRSLMFCGQEARNSGFWNRQCYFFPDGLVNPHTLTLIHSCEPLAKLLYEHLKKNNHSYL